MSRSLSPRPERFTRKVWPRAAAAGLGADQAYRGVADEGMEDADRVRAAAHAGEDRVGQTPGRFEDLAARLDADHALEIAHDRRIGMRAERRAEQIVGVVDGA